MKEKPNVLLPVPSGLSRSGSQGSDESQTSHLQPATFKLRRYLPSLSRWLPLLLWMAGIFYFSSRPEPLDFAPPALNRGILGRGLHIAEYAGLTLLAYRAVEDKESQGRITRMRWAGAIAFLYALSDELHQHWVPGRAFSLFDIALDSAGIALALLLLGLFRLVSFCP